MMLYIILHFITIYNLSINPNIYEKIKCLKTAILHNKFYKLYNSIDYLQALQSTSKMIHLSRFDQCCNVLKTVFSLTRSEKYSSTTANHKTILYDSFL